jgi:hypothetical protein
MALFAVMSIDVSLRRWTEGYKRLSGAWIVGASAISLAVIEMALLAYNRPGTARADCINDRVTRIFRSLPPATYVLSLQNGVAPISPLHAYADIRWSGEFGANIEISAIVIDGLKALANGRPRDPYFIALEQHVRAAVVRSLTLRPPRIVLVDVSGSLSLFERFDQPFNLFAWYTRDPAFNAAWANYEYVETVRSFDRVTVEVWRRRTPS